MSKAVRCHELKIWPEYFLLVESGEKTFEIRFDDRGYQVGDTLLLQEYDRQHDRLTGRFVTRYVSYIYTGPPLPDAHVVLALGLEPIWE